MNLSEIILPSSAIVIGRLNNELRTDFIICNSSGLLIVISLLVYSEDFATLGHLVPRWQVQH
jgi:hypothetical protein